MARIQAIDGLRGVAILMMVFYHFLFDLNYFDIFPIPIQDIRIVVFQRIIGVLFVGIAGFSIMMSEKKNTNGWMHHVKRGLFLAVVAMGITLATWVYPHEGFIQFGIIHLMAASILLAPLFFRFGKWNAVLGLFVILAGLLTPFVLTTNPFLFWLGFTTPAYFALDHYPLLPWLGVFLMGIAFASWEKCRTALAHAPKLLENPLLSRLGKKSLLIYLIHQPMLVGLLLLGKMAGFW